MSDLLVRLANILEDRKTADPELSYTASLYSKGLDAVLKKIGEEATETIMAGKARDKQAVIHETADLWFHTMVLLAQLDLKPEDVLSELENRLGQSGLEEKAQRK